MNVGISSILKAESIIEAYWGGIIIRKDINKFRVFMFIFWAMILGMAGMYTMYLAQLGFSKKEVSICVTLYTVSGIIGQSFVGYLVDKYKSIRKIMFLVISTGLLVATGLVFAKVNWQIYLLISMWAFFISGSIPLSDTWCIDTLKFYGEQRNFGKIRGFGSIGYGLAGSFFGLLLQRFGWKIYNWYLIIGVLSTLLVIYMMKDSHRIDFNEKHEANNRQENISIGEALWEIFKIRPLILTIGIIFIYTFVVRGIYSYLGVLIGDYGGGAASLGFTYFFDATPEVVTFFLASKLIKKFKSKGVIFAAFLLQIVRLSVILIFNNAMAVILMGVLSGFAYGLIASSYKTYIYELSPAKYRVTCISLSESIIGISGIISAPVFGFIFTKFGTNAAIAFGLIIYVLLAIIMGGNLFSEKKTLNKKVFNFNK
jgi:MFS transporter, PPP family, 3-phenylpropionic acid transporter